MKNNKLSLNVVSTLRDKCSILNIISDARTNINLLSHVSLLDLLYVYTKRYLLSSNLDRRLDVRLQIELYNFLCLLIEYYWAINWKRLSECSFYCWTDQEVPNFSIIEICVLVMNWICRKANCFTTFRWR